MSTGLAERLDNIKDTVTISCSKVVYGYSCFLFQFLYCTHMSDRKVNYMDIITDTCTVMRIIVISEYSKTL